MPVADNKHHSLDSNSSRSAQNGGSGGQQKHGSSSKRSNKRSGSKSMVSTYFNWLVIKFNHNYIRHIVVVNTSFLKYTNDFSIHSYSYVRHRIINIFQSFISL